MPQRQAFLLSVMPSIIGEVRAQALTVAAAMAVTTGMASRQLAGRHMTMPDVQGQPWTVGKWQAAREVSTTVGARGTGGVAAGLRTTTCANNRRGTGLR